MTCHGWSTHAVDRCFNVNFHKLIQLTRVTGRSNGVTHKYLLERFRMYEERGEHGMFSAKLDLQRGLFLWMSIVPRHSDQLFGVRPSQDSGAVALWSWEHGEAQITEGCRVMWVDAAAGDVSAMLTQMNRFKKAVHLDQVPDICNIVVRGTR